MGKRSGVDRLQLLSRIGAIGILGGLAAGCSTDASRMAGSPFSNPFGSGADPSMTGSPPERPAAKAPPTPGGARALPAPEPPPRAPASGPTTRPAPAPAPVTQTGAG